MYFWKTGKLASDIKTVGIEEAVKMSYYLATTIITLIMSMLVIALSPQKDIYSALVECISLIIISILGIKITFASNKGNLGIDYIGRVVALSFPLSIKMLFFGFIFGFVLGLYVEMSKNTAFMPWATSLSTVIIQMWYFWRLNIHLRFINA